MADTFTKDPDAVLDYACDWSAWLSGDTIASSTWTVPDGLTEGTGDYESTHTATEALVWLSGGTAGRTYAVTNRITTTEGREDERTIYVRVRER